MTTGFDQFWKAYPRKVGKGKSERIWLKLKVSEGLLKQILTAVAEQRSSRQWIKSNGEFIPHPSTWLAQKRWEDEPDDGIKSYRSQTETACLCCKEDRGSCHCVLWDKERQTGNFCEECFKCQVCCTCLWDSIFRPKNSP